MHRVLFDARVTARGRTTGWERYARELGRHLEDLSPDIEVFRNWRAHYRFIAPWEVPGNRPASPTIIHYPAIPPAVRGKEAKVVLTLHDMTWWKFPQHSSRLGRVLYRRTAERALRTAAAVLVDSHAVLEEVVDAWPGLADRCVVVYPGADHERDKPDADPRRRRGHIRDKPYFLFVGTQEPRKNVAVLLAAYERSGLAEDYDLVMVGRVGWGERPGVQSLTGVSDVGLQELYRGATATVLPSLYEGFGLPIVESFRFGTPVLCSDIPVFREVSRGRAHFFDARDEDSLAARLWEVVSAPDADNPEDLVRIASSYSWRRSAEQVISVYEAL